MSITADNYTVSIWTNSGKSRESTGLVNGWYLWAIDATTSYLGDYTDGIITDEGITVLKRSADFRTGGGNSPRVPASVSIMGGIYADIENYDSIIGKRITIHRATSSAEGGGLHLEPKFVGVVTTVDVIGFKSVINFTVESENREANLPYNCGAIGEVAVDGTGAGTQGYFLLNKYKVVVKCITTAQHPLTYTAGMEIAGATTQNVAHIPALRGEIISKLEGGHNVYYEGENGTYRITTSPTVDGDNLLIFFNEYVSYGSVREEVDSVGSILWTDEVYNSGLDGAVTIDADGNMIEIDDVNNNVVPYRDGTILEAGDGIVWRSLTVAVVSGDFYAVGDAIGGNTALLTQAGRAWQFDPSQGVYYENNVPDSVLVGGGLELLTDRTSDTYVAVTGIYTTLHGPHTGLGWGVQFVMNGYRFLADRLYCVVDFMSDIPAGKTAELQVAVTAHVGPSTSSPVYEGVFGSASVTVYGNPRFVSLPSGYTTYAAARDTYRFYHPSVGGVVDDGTRGFLVDITDAVPTHADGHKYYDDLRLMVAVTMHEEDQPNVVTRHLDIGQINIVEGYEIGLDGLGKNRITVDNSATNGTIPLAYRDVVKRQNLFGINATPPPDGWGTEAVQEDGQGVTIDTGYIMGEIPNGELCGVLGETTTTVLKKEIARSVPAVSGYNRHGLETLVPIGVFTLTPADTITYSDISGELKLTAYGGENIHPALKFTFGPAKLRFEVTNTEADTYSSAYVIDEIGVSTEDKQELWGLGHALSVEYGLSTAPTATAYPIVSDSAGVVRIVTALYANMGCIGGVVYPRMIATADVVKSVSLDVGTQVLLDTPQVTGVGTITAVGVGVYDGTDNYTIDMIDTVQPTEIVDILITGSQPSDILITGSQADDILIGGTKWQI